MIVQELVETQSDLMCLQEVQADHYETFLKNYFYDLGFDSLYKQKSRESMVSSCNIFILS